MFIFVLSLSPQRLQPDHGLVRQRSGSLGRKLRLVDLPLQFLLLQHQRALLGGQPVLLLPLFLQSLLARLQRPAELLGLFFAGLIPAAQHRQLFLRLTGRKLAVPQFLFQLGYGGVIVLDIVLLDGSIYLCLRDRVLIFLDATTLMLDVEVRVLCLFLDLLNLPLDLVQPLLCGSLIVGGKQSLILQLRQLPSQLCQLLQPQADLQRPFLLSKHQILLCLFALRLQRAYTVLQFAHDIAQPHQIILCLLQLSFRLGLAVAKLGNSRGFLKDFPPLGAFRTYDLRNLSLLNNRIAVPSQTGIHKGLVDIPQAHRIIIDTIFAFTASVQPAGDNHLIAVNFNAAVGIINKQAHPGKAGRLTGDRAAENDVLHFCPAQAFYRLLAEYPLDCIADITFSAAVRTYYDGDPVIKGQLGAVGEGFESLHFHRFQLHGISS